MAIAQSESKRARPRRTFTMDDEVFERLTPSSTEDMSVAVAERLVRCWTDPKQGDRCTSRRPAFHMLEQHLGLRGWPQTTLVDVGRWRPCMTVTWRTAAGRLETAYGLPSRGRSAQLPVGPRPPIGSGQPGLLARAWAGAGPGDAPSDLDDLSSYTGSCWRVPYFLSRAPCERLPANGCPHITIRQSARPSLIDPQARPRTPTMETAG